MKKTISYYEFPNGSIVKSVNGDAVYRYNSVRNIWEADYSLTAIFSWDRPYGEPCENLRKKVDLSDDLPSFPKPKEFVPGNTVLIGAYPQLNAHDFSPIEWIVLEVSDKIALCISKKCLITSCYNEAKETYGNPELLRWEHSKVRSICNNIFYENAFSEEEKHQIIPRTVSVRHGNNCEDSIFLLSEDEVCKYLPTCTSRQSEPTTCALMHGALTGHSSDLSNFAAWWLLPEEDEDNKNVLYPKVVLPDGMIQYHGRNIYHNDFTIRPCIQVKID